MPDRRPRLGVMGTNSRTAHTNAAFSRCKTCAMVSSATQVPVSPVYTIRQHFTCASESVVYLITCTLCNAVYVGETGTPLRRRITHHRSDIHLRRDTAVAEHFQGAHAPRVAVLESTARDVVVRTSRESMWISRFRASPDVRVLNRDGGLDFLPV